MKNVLLIGKIIVLAFLGLLIAMSLMMFPFLIGAPDTETINVGLGYLGLLVFSSTTMILLLKKGILKQSFLLKKH